ncbi:MAG: hypothetical protein K2N94_17150, partial [Lachnospiraceae bacterium]|nr:hypothetical protein [Lachnospiraceae bacterium]
MKTGEAKTEEAKKIRVLFLIRQFAGYAWKCNPKFFVFYILDVIVYAAAPFVNIIFPAYLIDELTGEQRIDRLALYTALTAGINLLCNLLKNVFDTEKGKCSDTFERYISMLIAEKCVDMDFQHTEDKKVLEQLEKARTGMDWYSGGIAGIMEAFGGFVTDLITMLGVVTILAVGMPWLIVVYAVSVVFDMLLTRATNRVELKAFRELAKVNQIFSYVFWELQDIRFGKDIRLYGAEPMMEEKGRYYNNQMTKEWKRQAVSCLPYNECSTLLGVARNAAAMLMIGMKALRGLISIGDFMMYFNAGNTLRGSLWGMTWR